jgi:ketosteroid isomerase-like protein
MKKILTFISIIAMTITQSNAQSKSEEKVGLAVEKLKTAMISGNRLDLESIAFDKLTYGHSSGKIEDKAAFVESIASKKSDFVKIDLSNQTIDVEGKTAIVRHVLVAETNDGGIPGSVKLHILLVFKKHKGDWKLLARQAVKVV